MKAKVCFIACVLILYFTSVWSQSLDRQPVPQQDSTTSNQAILSKRMFDTVFKLIHTPAPTLSKAYERAKLLQSYIYFRSITDTSYFDWNTLSPKTADTVIMGYFKYFVFGSNSNIVQKDSENPFSGIVGSDFPEETVDVGKYISTESDQPSVVLTSTQREKLSQTADSIILSYLKHKYKAYKREFSYIGNKYFLKRVRGEVTKDKNNWEYIEMIITYIPTSRNAGYIQITMEGKYYHCGPIGSGPSTDVILSDGKRFDERYSSEAAAYSNDLINELITIIKN